MKQRKRGDLGVVIITSRLNLSLILRMNPLTTNGSEAKAHKGWS
jgi:hypothetical protein